MARSRFSPFYRPFSFPFSHFESKLRRFFEGTSLFSAPKLIFSLLHPVLPHASGTSSRDLTLYFLRTPLFALREVFPIRLFPFFTLCSTFLFSIDFLSAPHSPRPSPPSPTFFLIPPHFSIFFPNKRTIARPLAHYARTRTPAHTHTSGGFRLLPSPLHPTFRNPLYINTLGVKENKKKPSQNTQQSQNQHLTTNTRFHPQ